MYTYRALGAFRLLLAALVMFQHFAANLASPAFSRAVAGYEVGSVAAMASFCLSGFVVAEAAERAYLGRPLAFLANRALRIVPHFVAAVVATMLLYRWFLSAGTLRVAREVPPAETVFAPGNIAGNLLGFLPLSDNLFGYAFLDIGWAVRVEVAFYLVVFACLVPGILHRRVLAAGLGPFATAAYAMLVPAFALSVLGRLPAMLAFVPYFGFGAALYFAVRGERAGGLVAAASIPLMLWQFLSQPDHHPTAGFERAVGAQLALLVGLVAAMAALAARPLTRTARIDRLLGDLTYPLYLYHVTALLLVAATFPPDGGYAALVWGAVLAVLVSVAFYGVIDPPLAILRDRVRGRGLDDRGTAGSGAGARPRRRWDGAPPPVGDGPPPSASPHRGGA